MGGLPSMLLRLGGVRSQSATMPVRMQGSCVPPSSIRARVRVSTRAATHARSGGAPSSVRCGRRPAPLPPPPQSRLARGCQYSGSTWGSRPRPSLWETGLALQAYISQTSNIEHNPAARRRGGWGRGSLLRYWGLCVSSIGTRVCGYAGK